MTVLPFPAKTEHPFAQYRLTVELRKDGQSRLYQILPLADGSVSSWVRRNGKPHRAQQGITDRWTVVQIYKIFLVEIADLQTDGWTAEAR